MVYGARLIWAAKVYGVKAVNPGGVTAWKWGKDAKQLHEPVYGYSKITPAQLISGLANIVDQLGLPHPMHLHCNNLGTPGNVAPRSGSDEDPGRQPRWQRLQFTPTAATTGIMAKPSDADRRLLQQASQPNLRRRRVLFGNAVTITADGPWQHVLYQLTGRTWGNLDVENETGCGIVPYTYKGSQHRQHR